ncbi:hypothetical protein [Leptodesmis sichuanensis]|uniref:hypothetical protein n=1 Tax=Leptodesmis sichuanensis TaxID=2906798 RepID=UPI001F344C3A|nr:hypothetical protein [Leptodesmis sichuanensis]UIE37767.1 hypothetical protein KIK02_23065 [Leptodesmis sichuanensis A121]
MRRIYTRKVGYFREIRYKLVSCVKMFPRKGSTSASGSKLEHWLAISGGTELEHYLHSDRRLLDWGR